MIGYVFWHQKVDSVTSSIYENGLKNFHSNLANAGIRGYLGSISFRVEGAYWFGAKKTGYEDWYYLTDSGVIDILNHGDSFGKMMASHNNGASLATGMHAGLYQLKSSSAKHRESTWVVWLSKPSGMSDEDFNSLVSSTVHPNNIDFWKRQMVLGPTPEFCIMCDKRIDLDPQTKPIFVKRTEVLKFSPDTKFEIV